jgi:hypothetical protein
MIQKTRKKRQDFQSKTLATPHKEELSLELNS